MVDSIATDSCPAISIDPSVRRRGRVLIGGTPLRLLRLTDPGVAVYERLADGERPQSTAAVGLARRLLDSGFAHPVVDQPGPPVGDVVVVIPVRDDADGLDRLLSSGTLAGVAEIVVVDDGSPTDAVASVAQTHGVTVLVNAVSAGPGGARERGWRSSDAPIVAFLDADCVPDTGWLEPLLGYFDDPEVVAVAPRVSGINGPATSVLARFEADHGPIDRGVGPARVGVGPVPFVPGAALLVRRRSLDAVGGFDETLLVGEDVDLVWRLLEVGTVRYEPAANVTHRPRSTVSSWVRQRFRYGQSAAMLDERHPGRLAAIEMNPWTAASWALSIAAPRSLRLAGTATGVLSTALLGRRLSGTIEAPLRTAVDLAGRGNLRAGRWLAETARREWWPVAVVGAVVSKRLRRPALVALVGYPLLDELQAQPRLGVLPSAVLGLTDDVAYGAGVWVGCIQRRRWGPLLPRIRRT